jgi:hypothetical protein
MYSQLVILYFVLTFWIGTWTDKLLIFTVELILRFDLRQTDPISKSPPMGWINNFLGSLALSDV